MTRTTHASQAESPPLKGSSPERLGQGTQQGRNDRRNDGSLYSLEERKRRDESVWTMVQGVLAPLQFIVFIVSLALVIRTLATGDGAFAADVSIIIKTMILYTIMVTGSIWEKQVFGKWLFAPAFFWEDVFSMLVLGLHTAYLILLFGAIGTVEQRLGVALAAYAAYVINAGQFLWKLRQARLQASQEQVAPEAVLA